MAEGEKKRKEKIKKAGSGDPEGEEPWGMYQGDPDSFLWLC